MQDIYKDFSYVYDRFMNNLPYVDWVDYVASLLAGYGITEGLVCELGCGTGNITQLMAIKGYDMIGIDISEDMLYLAREKNYGDNESYDDNSHDDSNHNGILYLQQDMMEFELYGTVRAFICLGDSANYITEKEDLVQMFRLVNNYLDKDGVFIFDLKTEYLFKSIGDRVIAENHEDCSIIWENEYFGDEKINQYEVTMYMKVNNGETGRDLYKRHVEVHHQKAYEVKDVINLISESGLEFLEAYDFGTRNKPTDTSERICFVTREKYQEGKSYEES